MIRKFLGSKIFAFFAATTSIYGLVGAMLDNGEGWGLFQFFSIVLIVLSAEFSDK